MSITHIYNWGRLGYLLCLRSKVGTVIVSRTVNITGRARAVSVSRGRADNRAENQSRARSLSRARAATLSRSNSVSLTRARADSQIRDIAVSQLKARSVSISRVRSVSQSGRVIMTGTRNMEVTTTTNLPGGAAKWSGCDCCRKVHSSAGGDGQMEVNVSFAGCGFLGIYHLGVLRCFLTHGKHMLHRVKRWGGASAGALAAASIICIPNKLDEALNLMNTLIQDIQGKPLGPLTPGYNMMDTLRTELEKILPPNAHQDASGRLFLSATCITDRKNMLLSEFDTREELIQALLCSCYIPVYGGYKIPTYRGKKYIDGGLSVNMPKFSSGTTICISPFSGPLQQICPNDNPWYENLYSIIAGHSFQINTQNIVRGFQALFPPHRDILESYNSQGWDDALDFLKKNGYTEDHYGSEGEEEEIDSDLELE